ncbi:MAG: hypothetical protein AMXMBFR34_41250 [Myxococcaceae bacterium]
MAINLKNGDVERALQELSRETGESLTEAAGVAFRERLERLRAVKQAERQRSLRALLDLVDEARAAPVIDPRPLKAIRDELWGDE